MTPIKDRCIQLSSGFSMPIIGLGTGNILGNEARLSVRSALECGYRAFDTGYFYKNEEPIGTEINDWISSGKILRQNVFITTKLPLYANRAEDVPKYLGHSLKNLKMDYVDLYLIHHPFGTVDMGGNENQLSIGPDGKTVFDHNTDLESIWKAMEDQVDAGRAKSIGLSNFNSSQIDRIMKIVRIRPANLQIEVHAYMQQKPLIEHCKKLNISVSAYSPIGAPYSKEGELHNPKLLDNPTVLEIAKTRQRTPSQVLLKFLIQKGLLIVPKSSNPKRIKENIELDFELTSQEVNHLELLDRGSLARVYHFTTVFKGVDNHKEYPFAVPY